MRNENFKMNCKNHIMREGKGFRSYWHPTVEVESSDGIREEIVTTRFFSNRKLFLTGELTEEMANDVVAEMLYLAQTDEPVDIYINTPEGSVNAGMVIYDLIRACEDRNEINMYCVGIAASMGAVILAGDRKDIGLSFHITLMIHEALIAGGMSGSASTIKKTAESILETKSITNGLLAKHTGNTLKQIDKATSIDNFMNAEEAIKFGLCDAIKIPF